MFFEAGADLGDPDTFYPADRWNPDGYFEQHDIHAVNMPLINGPFWKFANFRLPSTKTILRRAEPKSEQIRQTAAKYQDKVVKETRFALTMPAWEKYGTEFDRILICLRDPIAAAKSISKRYRVPMFSGYYIWTTYFSRLLENLGDQPVWYIRYGYIMKEETFNREMGTALRFMGYDLSPEQLHALRQKCVKPDLHHNKMSKDNYPPQINELWMELLRRYDAQWEQQPTMPLVPAAVRAYRTSL
jgi:hypothetical protein